MFNMNNLITGDLVICNNGKMATVMRGTSIGAILRFHTEKDSFSYLGKRYNDDLTHKTCKGLTISKVYRVDPDKIDPGKIGDLIANPDKMLESGTVIFDRGGRTSVVPAMATIPVGDTDKDKPTIADLMTGDMLVHRNGKVSTVYKDTPFGDIIRYATEKNSFTYLYKYDNETLAHESKDNYDIVGVFRVNADDESTAGDAITNPAKMITPKNAIWIEFADGFIVDYFRDGENLEFAYNRDDNDDEDY